MAVRVTDVEVKEIIDTTVTTTPFVAIANILVDKYLSGHGLSDALLKEIERWWSAHLVAIRDMRPHAEKIGDTSINYQGKTDMGLNCTLYGQQLLTMDPTGILAKIGKKYVKVETVQSPTDATP